MSEPKVLLSGLGIPESPRWHEGRLWFCNWIDRQVVAVGLDGESEVVAPGPGPSRPMGWSIDWLPDGRLVMTGDKLRRQEPDGSMTVLAEQPSNEIVVDGRGNVYINGADFDFLGGPDRRTLFILTVEWHPADGFANLDRLADGPRTGQILTLPVRVPGAGRP